MRKFLGSVFERMAAWLNKKSPQQEDLKKKEVETTTPFLEEVSIVSHEVPSPRIKKTPGTPSKKGKTLAVSYVRNPGRDLMEIMEVPFLALSKNRKSPILYESSDGTRKVKVTRHTGHFLASIYDWDIILFVASKMQRIINELSDIPPRDMVVPRHELLKAIHRRDGKKTDKDLEKTLARLQLTGIETTIRNEDYRYKAGFGFLDSWGYTERKDVKEIRITLSQWLYDGICAKGSLLKVDPTYFKLTSGLKRFLYRTARKHAGNDSWEFSIAKLYEKSGSEQEFKKFKSDLKAAVLANNIPDYCLEWIEKDGKTSVFFKRFHLHKLERLAEEFEKKQENTIEFNTLGDKEG
jgi:plasmid replication initiation protein